MNAFLTRPPVLVDGTPGLITSIGTGGVALGAGAGLPVRSRAARTARSAASPDAV